MHRSGLVFLLLTVITVNKMDASILNDFNHFNAASYGTAESSLAVKNEINNLGLSPASLVDIEERSAAFSYVRWLDMINIYHLGYGMSFKNTGTAGISIDAVSLNIDNYLGEGERKGSLQNQEYQAGLGFARKINSLCLGINIKYLAIRIDDRNSSWIGTGFNGIYQIKIPGINIKKSDDNLLFTAGLQNISIKNPVLEKENSEYPVLLLTGMNYNFWRFSDHAVYFSSAYQLAFKYNDSTWSIGTVFNYKKLLYLRTGLYLLGQEFNTITMGLGIRQQISPGKILNFDYCLMPGERELNHCAGIKLDF